MKKIRVRSMAFILTMTCTMVGVWKLIFVDGHNDDSKVSSYAIRDKDAPMIRRVEDVIISKELNEHDQNTLMKTHADDTKTHQLVFYNKVQKCGSTSLLSIANYLSNHNISKFKVYEHVPEFELNMPERGRGRREKEARVVTNLRRPSLYARHVYYINFRDFDLENPIYINMVRDPVERFVSDYYFEYYGSFIQNKSQPINVVNINECILKEHRRCTANYYVSLFMTRYFCGHSDLCAANPDQSIEIAKRNIENEFLFVGLTEEFDNSLMLLEKILPNFFSGAHKAWKVLKKNEKHAFSTVHKEKLSTEAESVLRKKLWADYELYRFVERRFRDAKLAYGV